LLGGLKLVVRLRVGMFDGFEMKRKLRHYEVVLCVWSWHLIYDEILQSWETKKVYSRPFYMLVVRKVKLSQLVGSMQAS